MKNRGTGDYDRLDAKAANIGTVVLKTTTYDYLKAVLMTDASTEGAQYSVYLASTGLLSSAVAQKAWAFDATKSELLPFSVVLPSGYKEGTNVTPCINWFTTSSTGSTQAVKMLISYQWTNQDTAMASTATETTLIISTTGTSALTMYTTNFTACTGTGKEVGSNITGVIARVSTGSTDDFSADFWIRDLFFYFQKDGFGSTAGVSDK
jgi:hypothetical protein